MRFWCLPRSNVRQDTYLHGWLGSGRCAGIECVWSWNWTAFFHVASFHLLLDAPRLEWMKYFDNVRPHERVRDYFEFIYTFFPPRVSCVYAWYEWDIWSSGNDFRFYEGAKLFGTFFFFFCKICYVVLFYTSPKWKIIDVKMKLFSIRCSSCHFNFLSLFIFIADKICIYPPVHAHAHAHECYRSYRIVQLANQVSCKRKFLSIEKAYTKILSSFNLVHFSMISFSFHKS